MANNSNSVFDMTSRELVEDQMAFGWSNLKAALADAHAKLRTKDEEIQRLHHQIENDPCTKAATEQQQKLNDSAATVAAEQQGKRTIKMERKDAPNNGAD